MSVKTASRHLNPPRRTVQTKLSRTSSQNGTANSHINPLQMQQYFGNRGTQILLSEQGGSNPVQAKLAIGAPDDPYEREADAVADKVMRMSFGGGQDEYQEEVPIIQKKPFAGFPIQRMCADCEKELNSGASIQKKPSNSFGNGQSSAPDSVMSVIESPGSGSLLSESIRSRIEPVLGADLSSVRVHTDSQSKLASRDIQAKAFTYGNNIFLGAGQSTTDTKLMAHEATHVVQQNNNQVHRLQKDTTEPSNTNTIESLAALAQKTISNYKNKYVQVYWMVDAQNHTTYVIPKHDVEIQRLSNFIFNNTQSAKYLAEVNGLEDSSIITRGQKIKVTGIKQWKASRLALASFNSSIKIPIWENNPATFIARKKMLDKQLVQDFSFVTRKLDESHYSDFDENQVISILQRWGEERLTTNPNYYPNYSDYLDQLFLKLRGKLKDVGTITTQWTSYYDLIFNHFDNKNKVKRIRDRNSKLFKNDSGIKEMSFGSFFWDEVKEGQIRDQIFAFGKGLAKGFYSGAKGTVVFIKTLATDPGKVWEDLKKMPAAMKMLWVNRSKLWKKFVNASPEEQAEMIGKLTGEVQFMISLAAAGGAAVKGLEKTASAGGKLGKAAEIALKVVNIPSKAVSVVAKGVKTTVVMGVKGAAAGAKFAAKGIFYLGRTILKGSWSVVETVVNGVVKKVYFFYDESIGVLHRIRDDIARLYVRCSECELTQKAKGFDELDIEINQLDLEINQLGRINKIEHRLDELGIPFDGSELRRILGQSNNIDADLAWIEKFISVRTNYYTEIRRRNVLYDDADLSAPIDDGLNESVSKYMATIEGAHDVGVSMGRIYAESILGLQEANWVNAFQFRGSRFGQGFDDVLQDSSGNLWIVEYKGGTAKLAENQMTRGWVRSRIARYRNEGGELGRFWAASLQKALDSGRLRGIALSTPIDGRTVGETFVIDTWVY